MPMCDTIGPMARSAADMRSLLSAMDLDHGGADDAATSRLRIGIDESLFANADPEVGRLVWDAVDVLNQQDVAVRKLDIPDLALMGDVFRGLIDAAAYSVNGPSFEARPDLFGHGVRQRLEAGKEVRGHEVFKRLGAVDLWRASLEPIFRDEIDILICPTTRASAPLLAHMASAYTPPDLGALTFPWSLAGFPALTLPVGQTREGLPAGMQLIAAKGRDQLILSVAEQFQARTSWHTARPAGRGTAAPHH